MAQWNDTIVTLDLQSFSTSTSYQRILKYMTTGLKIYLIICSEKHLIKDITFFKNLKSENNEVIASGILPRGDFYKENVEAVISF